MIGKLILSVSKNLLIHSLKVIVIFQLLFYQYIPKMKKVFFLIIYKKLFLILYKSEFISLLDLLVLSSHSFPIHICIKFIHNHFMEVLLLV